VCQMRRDNVAAGGFADWLCAKCGSRMPALEAAFEEYWREGTVSLRLHC
jgi:hypothetical protein